MKKYFKLVLFSVIGCAAGYGYYHFYGCTAGCPITSRWYVTSVYGLVLGLILAMPGKKK